MSDTTATDAIVPPSFNPGSDSGFPLIAGAHQSTQQHGPLRVGQLLAGLQQSTAPLQDGATANPSPFENRLALVRLGMATSLFISLQTRHAPTAAHSLRVALICSAWAERLGLDLELRDRLEVAALLHDLGKLGIPDRILRKPGKLTVDEQLTMDRCAELGVQILNGCTDDQQLLQIIAFSGHWFQSRRHEDSPRGDGLPLGARMLAIADAFDSMTIDTVYRPAMSRERAMQELIDGSGSQFDPALALDFNRMLEQRPEMLHAGVVDRWLQQLSPATGDQRWQASLDSTMPQIVSPHHLFYERLVSDLKDGVVFTDNQGVITDWNETMQQLTGIAAQAITSHRWNSECIRLRRRDLQRDETCPVEVCLATGTTVARAMMIEQPGKDPTPVHVQVTPVIGPTPGIHGTVVIVRDLTDQADLEEQVETLHQQTTRDPLTQVANRAWFDEVLQQQVDDANAGKSRFSLIICDIDHFKRVNDVYGHPAGDEALVSFATILNSHSRDGDLVARYGGEEFLLLTPHCDNAAATRRAEAIRRTLAQTALRSLAGESITASFGVTQYQPGDTPQTIVCRADRALLRAKDNGRNRVIQLGAGPELESDPPETRKSWLRWLSGAGSRQQTEVDIVTAVPVDLAIEKLRGFIADHQAELIAVRENQVSLKLTSSLPGSGRRRADRQLELEAHLTLSEADVDPQRPQAWKRTNVHVLLQPVRNRDRRGSGLSQAFAMVIASFKSYLMGEIHRPPTG